MLVRLFKNLVPKPSNKADSFELVKWCGKLLDDLLTAQVDIPTSTAAQTFVTVKPETSLPNSSQLQAGANITLTGGGPQAPLVIASTGGVSPLTTQGDTYGRNATVDARVPGPTVTGQVYTADLTQPTHTYWSSISGAQLSSFVLGDGSDGACHFDGAATVAGMVPVANVYTMVQSLYATTIVIDVGITVLTQNYNVFHTGNFTLNGVIGAPGNASPGGANNGTVGAAIPQGVWVGTAVPGAGGSGAGNAPATPLTSLGNPNTGAAGKGTSGTTAGGTAGTATPPTAIQGGIHGASLWTFASIGACRSNTVWLQYSGGCGGASGGGGGVGNNASGGGSPAGILLLAGLSISGTGTINMKGGAAGQSTSINVGGSNGGGGGILFVATSTLNYASLVTVDTSGGAGSAHTTSGSNTDGVAGGAGRVFNFFMAP